MIKKVLISHLTGLVLGVILDQMIGDPHGMPHPVRAIGRLIAYLEKKLLGNVMCTSRGAQDPYTQSGRDTAKEKSRGMLLWFIVVATTVVITLVVMLGAYRLNRYFGIAVEAVLTCYILAARSLCRESMRVTKELQVNGVPAARYALSMIVGRDTDCLDEEEIIKAAVETVAENTSDGVIAPLLYTALGGPVLGMAYKAVNTMDSMIGYRNEKYENFGWFAARADDVFNFIPSRLSAVLMIAASFLAGLFSTKYCGKRALEIWRRDRLNHSSPNSAQTESVCAGALGLKLGGTHLYGGIPVEKKTIGDEIRKPEQADVKRADILMLVTEGLAAFFCVVLLIIAVRCT
jgi:adenosylcobinamide-phosphate synthase